MAPAEGAATPTITVEVCFSPRAGQVERVALTLAMGSTLAQALDASGLKARYPEIDQLECGVWGRKAPLETVLRERDRVEVWRALLVDPKEARRQRYKGQGKTARRPR